MRAAETAVDPGFGDEHVLLAGPGEEREAVVARFELGEVGSETRRLVPGLVVEGPDAGRAAEAEAGSVAFEAAVPFEARGGVADGYPVGAGADVDLPFEAAAVRQLVDLLQVGVPVGPGGLPGARGPLLGDLAFGAADERRAFAEVDAVEPDAESDLLEAGPPGVQDDAVGADVDAGGAHGPAAVLVDHFVSVLPM